MKNITNIIVSGSIARDEIVSPKGTRNELGGTGTNIAYNTRLITQSPIRVLGSVGKDGGDFINFFKTHGIATNNIFRDTTRKTAKGRVTTDKSQNQVWEFSYGALVNKPKIPSGLFQKNAPLLILSATHEIPFLSLQKKARSAKMRYAYDPGMALAWIKTKDLEEGVWESEWCIANENEMKEIEKRLKFKKSEFLDLGKKLITTLGSKGVLYQSKAKTIMVPAYKVKKAIDPTGAGDAWRGGFWGSLAESKPIEEALCLANALASFVVESCGTVNHKPSMKDIIKRANALKIKSLISKP